jgi:hypothetical protein
MLLYTTTLDNSTISIHLHVNETQVSGALENLYAVVHDKSLRTQ